MCAAVERQRGEFDDRASARCTNIGSWELVDRVRSGDATAFSVLYVSYIESVFSYVLARTRDWANAEEITSEAFLRAYRSIDSVTYRGASFRAWVMTIARNLIVDDTRSARRRYEVLGPQTPEDALAAVVDPATAVCEGIVAGELQRGMEQLTADQRQCLQLRFFERMSVSDVAVHMARSEGSVRALQMRAVRKLGSYVSYDLICA